MWREDSESERVKSLQDRAERKKGTHTGEGDGRKVKRREEQREKTRRGGKWVWKEVGGRKEDEQAGRQERRMRNKRKLSRP